MANAKARGGNEGGVFAVELSAARVKVCRGKIHGYSWEIFHSRNPTSSKTKRLRDVSQMAVCSFPRTVCSSTVLCVAPTGLHVVSTALMVIPVSLKLFLTPA